MKDPFNSGLSSSSSAFMVSSSTNPADGLTLRSRRIGEQGQQRHHDAATKHNRAQQSAARQSWASYLIQHQLALSCSLILAIFAVHGLVVLNEVRAGQSVDWIATLTAIIPPPIWNNLPQSWTSAAQGGAGMVSREWPHGSSEPYNPHETWSSMALALQYQDVTVDESTGTKQVLYGKGWNDLYMIAVWVLIWTALREAAMTYLLLPLGRHFGVGEQKKTTAGKRAGATAQDSSKTEQGPPEGKLLRFAEQGWLVIYDGCMWSFGIYQLYHSPYWADTTFYWRDYPKIQLGATMKWYYLIQFAFWIQQFLLSILGVEKRRKDFLEFLIHHIITCLLIGFSYSFNLTSVGHAVLCAMDFSDIVLAACKMLKYIHKDQLADVGFVFFVFTWVFSRHYYYGRIIWSVFVEAPKYAEMGWDPSRGLYFTPRILTGFQFLLCALYMVLLFWLAMIIRVVIKVLKGENSEDVRSEDEDEGEVDADEDDVETVKADLMGKTELATMKGAGLESVSTSINGIAVPCS
ncbi:TLC domain-containing protein [Mortierella sp. GBAus27b]|nr:sphingosine N-acyltransferase lag1 [Mortierella sp. GBA43]KAI8357763.1 TLC domain-containing protein [Mortierella sp. GBAus27b]